MQEFRPKIIAFYCSNCASSAADVSERMKQKISENVKIVPVPCTGRIEILHLLKPFEKGADAVCVLGCQEDSCQYIRGIIQVKKRVEHVKKILEKIGIEPERIEVFSLSASKGDFVDVINKMIDKVKNLGPIY